MWAVRPEAIGSTWWKSRVRSPWRENFRVGRDERRARRVEIGTPALYGVSHLTVSMGEVREFFKEGVAGSGPRRRRAFVRCCRTSEGGRDSYGLVPLRGDPDAKDVSPGVDPDVPLRGPHGGDDQVVGIDTSATDVDWLLPGSDHLGGELAALSGDEDREASAG